MREDWACKQCLLFCALVDRGRGGEPRGVLVASVKTAHINPQACSQKEQKRGVMREPPTDKTARN